MKKALSLILIMVLMLSLVACGESEAKKKERISEFLEEERYLLSTTFNVGNQSSVVMYKEDTNTVLYQFWMNGFADALMINKNSPSYKSTWDNMKNSMVSLCKERMEVMAEKKIDANIMMEFLNDKNPEKTLLTIENGKITYSYLK